MNITIAICTWNRAALLDQTLERMKCLQIPDGMTWELLVVNNNCTDNTDAVLRKHAVGPLPLRRLFEPTPGLSNARNRILDEATGDMVAWTDDDVLVDPHWVANLTDAATRHPSGIAFGGVIDPWFPVEPDKDLLAVFPPLRMGFCGVDHGPIERLLAPTEHVVGANMTFRRSTVEGLRFNPKLGRIGNMLGGWDDFDFVTQVRRRGGEVIWVPSARVRHYVDPTRMTIEYMQRYYEGLGDSQIVSEGIPPGRQLAGVPGWLLKGCASAYIKAWIARLKGDRRQSLECTKIHHYRKGMVLGCRRHVTSHERNYTRSDPT